MELPQVQELMVSWRRMLKAQSVWVVVSDRDVICCWKNAAGWVWRSALWPPDGCRGGVPLQREPMGELLADLLLDCDVDGAQIELLLPVGACNWRVLDGVTLDKLAAADFSYLNPAVSDEIPPSQADYRSYLSLSDCVVEVSTPRQTLQSWIDVIELADLPLRRVTWTLSSAFRATQCLVPPESAHVAWLVKHSESSSPRLILLRDGIPEVDRQLNSDMDLGNQVRQTVDAWTKLSNAFVSVSWVLTAPETEFHLLAEMLQCNGELLDLGIDSAFCPEPLLPDLEPVPLDPLAHLALMGAWQEAH